MNLRFLAPAVAISLVTTVLLMPGTAGAATTRNVQAPALATLLAKADHAMSAAHTVKVTGNQTEQISGKSGQLTITGKSSGVATVDSSLQSSLNVLATIQADGKTAKTPTSLVTKSYGAAFLKAGSKKWACGTTGQAMKVAGVWAPTSLRVPTFVTATIKHFQITPTVTGSSYKGKAVWAVTGTTTIKLSDGVLYASIDFQFDQTTSRLVFSQLVVDTTEKDFTDNLTETAYVSDYGAAATFNMHGCRPPH